ncbi:hypothetical protein ACHAXR_009953 [Thalassiosira sp. AJA248-18]
MMGIERTHRIHIGGAVFLLLLSSSYINWISIDGDALTTAASKPTEIHQQDVSRIVDRCKYLKLHEEGAWQHYYSDYNNRSIGLALTDKLLSSRSYKQYFPFELDWFSGKQLPAAWGGKGACLKYVNATMDVKSSMYLSQLGNQCGCGMNGFEPSHSVWMRGNHTNTTNDVQSSSFKNEDDGKSSSSPSFMLIEALAKAKQTLCFFGDSIDFQFYDALQLNLQRAILLQDVNASMETRLIPINYTNDTGPSWFGNAESHGWRYMDNIMQTKVTLGNNLNTSFSYFKSYGWAPGHTSFLDDCSVIICNLGLHYNIETGQQSNAMGKTKGSTLANDFRAAITYLADFASSGDNRVAIWRSALPQHFNTSDGHFREGKGCSILTRKKPNLSHADATIQLYNTFYNKAFAEFCNVLLDQTSPSECESYEVRCTVNRISQKFPTLFKYYTNERCCEKRLERLKNGNATVSGTILRWNIADIFDVPLWHASGSDCSHFCYVPALYETAFERLRFLLPPTM